MRSETFIFIKSLLTRHLQDYGDSVDRTAQTDETESFPASDYDNLGPRLHFVRIVRLHHSTVLSLIFRPEWAS